MYSRGTMIVPGNSPPKTRKLGPGADDRDRADEAVDEPEAGAESRSSGSEYRRSLDQCHRQQADADEPVDLTRLAERAGEEDAEHVHRRRGDEQHGGPVVDLAHEQAATTSNDNVSVDWYASDIGMPRSS